MITAAAFDLAFSTPPPLPPPLDGGKLSISEPSMGEGSAGGSGGAGTADVEAEVVEENIAQLLEMGLCPQGSEQARAALETVGGDLSAAVALLCDA